MTTSTAPTIAPATYCIDPVRSTIRFAAKAMFLTVRGTFTVREGTITVADDVTRSTVTRTSSSPAARSRPTPSPASSACTAPTSGSP